MKVPAVPPATFRVDPDRHIKPYRGPLWRVFRTEGPHALAWDRLRHYGPVPNMRFDPHPPPAADHPDVGVMYTAANSYTALGEVYQDERIILRHAGVPTIASWSPTRTLQLLDLTTNWPVLNGAAAAMMMDDKQHTQAWAHAIDRRLGAQIDGLYHRSAINDQPVITLFSRTERTPAFPTRPRFHVALRDPAADPLIHRAKALLNYASA